jgi:hypothetical protein
MHLLINVVKKSILQCSIYTGEDLKRAILIIQRCKSSPVYIIYK